jgi:hypothetical protein
MFRHVVLVLVLGLVGCGSEPTQQVSATWAIRSLDGAPQPCPDGYDTVAVVATLLDADGFDADVPEVELFPCTANAGVVTGLPAGRYEVRIAVQDAAATMTYASSVPEHVDLTRTDGMFYAEILTDGGYARIGWSLLANVGIPSHNPITCEDAGIVNARLTSQRDDGGGTDTSVCPCDGHDGACTSNGLAPGLRAYTLDFLDASDRVVETVSSAARITAPNGLYDVGYAVVVGGP